MPCSGCARRRAKMLAAYNAVKAGFVSAKKSYAAEAFSGAKSQPRSIGEMQNVTDIREKQA